MYFHLVFTILITFLAFKRITNVVAYDKVDTLSDYDFGPEINLLIKFPQQEFFWSPFENKASIATKKSCWSQKKIPCGSSWHIHPACSGKCQIVYLSPHYYFSDSGVHMSHFDSCQLTLIWFAHITLKYCQPTDGPVRHSFIFMLNW